MGGIPSQMKASPLASTAAVVGTRSTVWVTKRSGWSAVPSRTLAFRPVMDRIIQAAVR